MDFCSNLKKMKIVLLQRTCQHSLLSLCMQSLCIGHEIVSIEKNWIEQTQCGQLIDTHELCMWKPICICFVNRISRLNGVRDLDNYIYTK